MSEEKEVQEVQDAPQESGTSTLKKSLIAIVTTLVTALGGYLVTHIEELFGEEEAKTETAAPAAAPIINLNVDNSSQNNSSNNGGGTTTIIKEKTIEKAAPAQPAAPAKKSETEDSPW